MPETLRIAYARGVTPGKWARIWAERFPRVPLELTMSDAVTDAAAQLTPLREAAAALAFIRLPAGHDGEPSWPAGERPADVHFIGLYEEVPFVVAPKGTALEAADDVTVAELAGEVRHPFADDVAMTFEVVAAGVGVVVVPQSIARLYARKDLVARPVVDLPGWRVGAAWLTANDDARVADFIGVVRGRTANSSRGTGERQPPSSSPASAAPRSADAGARPTRRAASRPSRGGRKGRRSTR